MPSADPNLNCYEGLQKLIKQWNPRTETKQNGLLWQESVSQREEMLVNWRLKVDRGVGFQKFSENACPEVYQRKIQWEVMFTYWHPCCATNISFILDACDIQLKERWILSQQNWDTLLSISMCIAIYSMKKHHIPYTVQKFAYLSIYIFSGRVSLKEIFSIDTGFIYKQPI